MSRTYAISPNEFRDPENYFPAIETGCDGVADRVVVYDADGEVVYELNGEDTPDTVAVVSGTAAGTDATIITALQAQVTILQDALKKIGSVK